MKRYTGLFNKLCTIENIELADKNARKNKVRSKSEIEKHDLYHDEENKALLKSLKNLTFTTSEYSSFKVHEPKEREIYKLPYYPDRIAQHAIMNVVKEIWVKQFIRTTYSCIEGRGIHKCVQDVKRDLRKNPNLKYFLKLDIKKCYPSIKHSILKSIIRKKIKDNKFLMILDDIIDSIEISEDRGVPIGNYLSQYFANLYFSELDRYCKEISKCRFYYRYADDIVIFSDNKEFLWNVFKHIKNYVTNKLDVEIKDNYCVRPISEGLDFIGYVFYADHVMLRKSIKSRIKKLVHLYKNNKVSLNKLKSSLTSYFGWLKYANSKRFLQWVYNQTKIKFSNWCGKIVKFNKVFGKFIKFIEIVVYSKYFQIHFIYRNKPYCVNSKSNYLFNVLSNTNSGKIIQFV